MANIPPKPEKDKLGLILGKWGRKLDRLNKRNYNVMACGNLSFGKPHSCVL